MSERSEYCLGELYDFSSGLSKSADQFGFGHSFLTFKDVFYNYFLPQSLSNLANTSEKERLVCSIKAGDVFLTRTSETQEELGMSSVALKDYPNATFNGFTKRLRPKKNVEILPEYAGYYFRSPKFRGVVTSMSSITTRASLNNSMLSALKMDVPKIEVQTSIGLTLKSLDDKIDLLHRQNTTLEKMAETLFRQWFVEEADQIWQVKRLKQLVDIGIGRTPPRKEFHWFSKSQEDMKWVSIKDLADSGIFVLDTSEYLTEKAVKKFNIPVIPPDTVLLSFKMTLGRVAITTEHMLSNEAIAHFKFRKDTPFSKEFLYYYLKMYPYETLGSTSSIVTSINSGMIKDMEVTIPSDDILRNFETMVVGYFNKIKSNQAQIRTLTSLRDALLPKLMSGEVRVSEL